MKKEELPEMARAYGRAVRLAREAVGKVTRYYTVEGTNVYFAMEQDGKPVDRKSVV